MEEFNCCCCGKIQTACICEEIKKAKEEEFKKYEKEIIFVAHISNHLLEMELEGKIKKNSKVCCKICQKDIDEIYKEELKYKKPSGLNENGIKQI